MFTSLEQFTTPKDIYNLLTFFNKFYDIKCLLIKFRFPSTSCKLRIYKYLKANHYVKLDTINYLNEYERDDFDGVNDLEFFKKVLYGAESDYSSSILTDEDYNQITIFMSYYFSTNFSDFEGLVKGLIRVLDQPINSSFLYSLVQENKGFKELEEEEYLVEYKSTDIKEILESLDMIKYMYEDNKPIFENIENIEKFFKDSL